MNIRAFVTMKMKDFEILQDLLADLKDDLVCLHEDQTNLHHADDTLNDICCIIDSYANDQEGVSR